MKRYCVGIFIIVFVTISVVPAFYQYATKNLAGTDIFIRPGWLYGLALVTSIAAAFICEMRSVPWKNKV